MALGSLGRQQITVIFRHPGRVCVSTVCAALHAAMQVCMSHTSGPSPAAGLTPPGTAAASTGPACFASAPPSATHLQKLHALIGTDWFRSDWTLCQQFTHTHAQANTYLSAAAAAVPDAVSQAAAAACFCRQPNQSHTNQCWTASDMNYIASGKHLTAGGLRQLAASMQCTSHGAAGTLTRMLYARHQLLGSPAPSLSPEAFRYLNAKTASEAGHAPCVRGNERRM